MKPVYEIVRAAELRVGDVVKVFYGGLMLPAREVTEIQKYPGGKQTVVLDGMSELLKDESKVLRQLPPERNPDVLMRALQDLHELAIAYAGIDAVGPLDGRIREAIREVESEGQK